MKRFHTPLTRILRLTRQRVRVQEHNLGRLLATLDYIEAQARALTDFITHIEDEISQLMGRKNEPHTCLAGRLQIDRLRALQSQLKASAIDHASQRDEQLVELARLRAHEQALEKTVTTRKQQHRKLQLKELQRDIDEQAITLGSSASKVF